MIKSAQLGKELIVTISNGIGILAKISKLFADHGINIEGIAGYTHDGEAKIMLITQDITRSVEALRKAGFEFIKEHEVIIVELENKMGALKALSGKLADNKIDINYTYGTVCSKGCPAKIVLATSDNEKAMVSFNKK